MKGTMKQKVKQGAKQGNAKKTNKTHQGEIKP